MSDNVFHRFSNRLLDPGNISDENVRRNREMSQQLLRQVSQPQNIQHPTQGLALLANALNAQIFRKRADRGETALKEQKATQMGELLGSLNLGPEQRAIFDSLPEDAQQQIAIQASAQRLLPTKEAGFTLSPGQTRFGGGGDEIASVEPKRGDAVNFLDKNTNQLAGTFFEGTPEFDRAVKNPNLFPTGAASQVQRRETGPPGTFSKPVLDRLQSGLNEQVAAVNAFGAQAERLLGILDKAEGANTLTAALTNVGNRVIQEVRTISREFGVEFEQGPAAFDANSYNGVFQATGLAGASARVKNGFLGLAIQRAMAAGLGTGRALSNEDIAQQLRTLGNNQGDPQIIRLIFADSFNNLNDTIRFKAEASGLTLPNISTPSFLSKQVSPVELLLGFNDMSAEDQRELREAVRKNPALLQGLQ